MSGEWLKFDKATPEKPEVFAIAATLGLESDAVVGKLLRVWSWFDTHTAAGNAPRVTPALLDRCAGVTGFVAAMEKEGWIVIENGGCSLPNFDRHCGETAKTRALGAKRSAGSRARNANSNAPSVTLPSPEKRREEKRREDKDQKPKSAPVVKVVKLRPELTLPAWLASLPSGEPAILPGDPLFAWAAKAGIPEPWLAMAWRAFEARYEDNPKTQADWRAVFRRAVREDWLRLWRMDAKSGQWQLTPAGEMAQREAA